MRKFGRDSKSVLLIFLLCVLSGYALSLSEGSPLPTVRKVSVLVDGDPAPQEWRELISIQEGDAYSLKKLDDILKQIYKTGLFSDIQIQKEGQEDVRLTFLLNRKLLTGKIQFQGEITISRRKLEENLYSLRPDSVFSSDKLTRAAEELKETLRRNGYFNSQIQMWTESNLKKASVDVFVKISSGRRFLIDRIDFIGETSVSADQLREKMESRKGTLFIPLKLDRDVARLREFYNSLGYTRAEIEVTNRVFQEEEGRVSLTITVRLNERIHIKIQGALIPEELLRPIWEERIFEEWGLVQGEARILAFLRKKGYIFAAVNSSIERAPGEILAVYEVNPGHKYRIHDVAFEGLQYFSSAALKKELGASQNIPLLRKIDEEKIFEIPLKIKKYYEVHGFIDTQVELNFRKEETRMMAIFHIKEGPQQRIKTIAFQGAELLTPAVLLSKITSVEEGPYFQPFVQRDIERLEIFYLNQGVRGTKITARVEEVEENLFSVLFDIREGRKLKIDRIVITGNAVTRKSTIVRELQIHEGDWAHYDRIMESRRGLERLGIFSEVKLEEIPVSSEAENLVISLREGERNYVGLGVGLETKGEPHTFAIWDNVIRPRGTVEFIRSNIFGRASQFSLITQFSLKEKIGVVSWEEPYFFGIRMPTYLNAWLEREERVSYGYDQRGTSLSGVKSFPGGLTLMTTFRWTSTTLYFLEIAESEVDRQHFPFSTTSLSESFILDRRDDAFNPEKGYFLSFVVEWAYPLFKVESDYLKTFFKYQHFYPLFTNLDFFTTVRIGLGRGRMPIHERFFAGGSNSFRGMEFDKLGPKDPNSQMPVGGKALLLFNFELRFPLFSAVEDLSAAIFYDVGNVFTKRKDIRLTGLRDAVGLGIRYRTPLGPLRFDLGWNLDSRKGERRFVAFITIGNVF
ncbi:MAG: POTRA domain-containing protein [Candidatus Aminicenantales bacterium]